MVSKQRHDNSSEESKSIDRDKSTATATAISKKMFNGSKICKVSFKTNGKHHTR